MCVHGTGEIVPLDVFTVFRGEATLLVVQDQDVGRTAGGSSRYGRRFLRGFRLLALIRNSFQLGDLLVLSYLFSGGHMAIASFL